MDTSQLTFNNVLKNFKKYSMEEEHKIINDYQTAVIKKNWKKAKELKDSFIENNLRLVIHVAMRFVKKHPESQIDDLVQDGTFGLMRALEKFQTGKNCKFSTYAVLWISQAIARRLEYQKEIRLPSHVLIYQRKYNNLIREFSKEHNRAPTPEEVKTKLDISDEMYEIVLKNISQAFSKIDPIYNSDEEWNLEEVIPDDTPQVTETIDSKIKQALLMKALTKLPPRKRDIIIKRFGIDCPEQSLESIGQEYKMSRERIRQLEKEALGCLKELPILQNLVG